MLDNLKDLIVLEYSVSQKAFHRSFLSDVLRNNILSLQVNPKNDYKPIAVFLNNEHYDQMFPLYKNIVEEVMSYDCITLSNMTIEDLLK